MEQQDWAIRVGDVRRRRQIHAEYGGGRQGGMEPSAKTPNVLLFTGPGGRSSGYDVFDGWHFDGTFHYTGEGPSGAQVMTSGNRAVRDHHDEGRALRLFEKQGTGPEVKYVGEFELPEEDPFLVDDAPGGDGAMRSVFIFRLRPVGETDASRLARLTAPSLVTERLPLELSHVSEYMVERMQEPQPHLRTEATLVHRYARWLLTTRNVQVERHRIPSPGGATLYTDVFDPSRGLLVEAKASATRHDIRTALGQVLDYARYVEHSKKAILLPSQPPQDLEGLLNDYGIGLIWPEIGGKFVERLV
ncbi:hypothetical protein DZG00_05495 [Clavibacter lycopersici]|uniref:ScoMcrA-like SRA domain-containing protein n=1 Tax=Clavibacter lycopersici TaxID=2301718 RepID=A0A399TAZ4_9MICO|nr:hypothetical protein [Clavibacter lycopersici]RIJ52284.1 hypothetical protein DZG00_05495 [Clavibacter lycopersici]RIJ62524.1 hypothetical protein DZG02_01330 [Clavibacter lycopersici]